MKIKPEHYQHMKKAIEAITFAGGAPIAVAVSAHREALKTDSRVKDLEKRLRWDLFYAARLSPFACGSLYSYVNDSHIDTALKSIMRELSL